MKDALKEARRHAKAGRWKAAQAWAQIALAEAQEERVRGILADAHKVLDHAQRIHDRTPEPDDPRLWVMPAQRRGNDA